MIRGPFTVRRAGHRDDSLLPLVNIVFLLLVFFMAAGRLDERPPFVVRPPAAAVEAEAARAGAVVALAADGRIAWRGAAIDRAALLAALAAERPPRVALRADAEVEATLALDLAAAIQGAAGGAVDLVVAAGPG